MVETILTTLVSSLLENLPPEDVRKAADIALDKVEEAVMASPNKIDDAIVLPLIQNCIRKPFGIEDNDAVTGDGGAPS